MKKNLMKSSAKEWFHYLSNLSGINERQTHMANPKSPSLLTFRKTVLGNKAFLIGIILTMATCFNSNSQTLVHKSTVTSTNGAEISAFDPSTNRIFTVAGPAMEYYSLSNTGLVSGLTNMPFGFTSPGNTIVPNSVAVNNGIVAVSYAIVNASTNAQQQGIVAFYQASTAGYIHHVTVGYLPDMVVFTPDGTKVLTANEGEPNSYGQPTSFDPEGSISIIDISGGIVAATVQTAGFTSFNSSVAALKASGVRIYGPGATVAQDLEPEYITFSSDGTKAYVTLQENNAIAEVNISTATVTQILPLGLKDHSVPGNGLDASDRDLAPGFSSGTINIQNWPVYGMYMPDAISSFSVGGNTYYITANEGDSRAYTGYTEEVRVGSAAYVLDPVAFPNASTLKLNQNLGRLQLSNASGDTDNDGDFDQIHALGARSFTIWNSSFGKIFDSGDQLEQITKTQVPGSFNSDGTIATFDTRSDNKGPEPEGVTVGMVNGVLYAFIGSERTGDIFVYDISNPAAPVFKQYIDRPADLGVEGIQFIPASQSPTGKALIIVSAEVSRTVSVYEFEPCLAPGIATISSPGTQLCPSGGSIKLFNQNSNSTYTYQWLKNGIAISGATDSTYSANSTGDYRLVAYNTSGCVDTSSVISITTSNLSASASATPIACPGGTSSASVSVTGGTSPFSYSWSTAVTPSVINIGASKDNSIFEQNTNNSNGIGEFLVAGKTNQGYKNRALLAFDIAGNIPAGSIITGSNLKLYLSFTGGSSGQQTHYLHRLNQNWGEGNSNATSNFGQGVTASNNDATWTNNYFSTSTWNDQGGTYSPIFSSSSVVGGTGYYNWSSNSMVSDVQYWLNNNNNFGWLLKSDEINNNQAKRYNSRENASEAYRPLLTVNYNAPAVIGNTNSVSNLVPGVYTVVVTDANGCTASSQVTINQGVDNINPTITAPAAISVCTNSGCTATGINLGTPVASDNCKLSSVRNNAPASFPLGTTTVIWTATDSSGNTATAAQTVTVTDGTAPSIYINQSGLSTTGITGPNSSATPYLQPTVPGVKFTSILTVPDAVGGYKMAGIPDGLGAFDNCDGTFTLLMNHELGGTVGVTRAHGSKGAFVSKWIINKNNLSVVSGSDLMQQAYLWNGSSYTLAGANAAAFSRFCSADLPPVSAFFNHLSGKGTLERIFMNGEESGTEGRAVGHIVTGPNAGKSYELPWLGKFAWENAVASPATGDKTVVAGLDDGTGGQVYFYIGSKTTSGTEIEKAGLNNGKLYGVSVSGFGIERVNSATINNPPTAGTSFSLVDLGNVSGLSGTTLNTNSVNAGVTSFSRPEDGLWDPNNPNDFYFATTDQYNQVLDGVGTQIGRSRLWRLRFTDVTNPTLGGTIEAVLDGTEGCNMLDNFGADKFGHLILQEDVGNQQRSGRIWEYTIATDQLRQIAKHDDARFGNVGVPATPPFNQDEESSGIIDVSDILGAGMHLLVDQAHYTSGIPADAVEGGQLLVMFLPSSLGSTGTAQDTLRVNTNSGCTATGVNLGTPATADNCSVASVNNNAPSAFPLGNTTVTWTVTDGSGNTATANQVVIVTAGNKAAGPASSTPSLCINSTLTAITHTTTGATGIADDGVSGANGLPAGVSATWSNNAITISGTPSTSGTFNYSIPLNGGCGSVNATGTIIVNANTTSDTTAAVCNSFTWHDSTYKASGDYVWYTKNMAGCDSAITLHLTILSVSSTTAKTDVLCANAANGTITVTPTSGVSPYTYRIGTTGSYGSSNTFTGLKAGNYRVSILDANGCAGTTNQVTIIQPPVLTATTAKTDAICYGTSTGAIVVTPNSGAAPFSYKLGATGTYGASNTFSNLRAGNYTVYLLDANSCPGTATAVVGQSPLIVGTSTTTPVLCNGGSTGSVTVTPSNGVAPHTYRYGTSGAFVSSNVFTNVKAGSPRIFIKDANGCIGSIVANVLQPNKIAATASVVNESCPNAKNGSITIIPTGGTSPYSYRYGTTGSFGTNNTFNNLKAGSYRIFVNDANNCSGYSILTTVAQTSPACAIVKSKKAAQTEIAAEHSGFSVQLSPNPSNSYFTLRVKASEQSTVQIRVIDVNGRNLFTAKGLPKQAFRFGESFAPGVYMIEVTQGNEVKTVKAVKVK